jgi:N-acetylmuramoyl-L-alanine amidase
LQPQLLRGSFYSEIAMTLEADIQRRIDSAVAQGDEQALNDLLKDLYEPAEHGDKPFDAAIQLRPEVKRELSEIAVESDAALNWANKIARAGRWVAYKAKTAVGFKGLRIVEEGDSWFQYPMLLDDTIDQLSRDADKAIFSLSGAGDLLEDMANRREYLSALQQTSASLMLLSGGGNDILGGGRFGTFLLPYAQGKTAKELLNMPVVNAELGKAVRAYRSILKEVKDRFPAVRVLGHAYDVPFPESDGRWIGKPLGAAGIPLDVGRSIVEHLLDLFTNELLGLEAEFSNYGFVNLRGKVDQGKNSWFDELHPRNAGYGRAAEEFRNAITDLVSAGSVEMAETPMDAAAIPMTRLSPGVSEGEFVAAAMGQVIVLDPGHGGAPPPTKLGGSSWNNAIGPQGTLEKTLTLDIAGRAKAVLEGQGHRVHLTRDTDINLSLSDRAKAARSRKAAVFVSIHFNASAGHTAQGTETFVHPDHAARSEQLCRTVQAAMVAALGLRDRNKGHPNGIKTGAFGVINGGRHATETAAVLHEVSFLDRADEEQRLMGEPYRDRIARALAHGISDYLTAGTESFVFESGSSDIGDAIELAASEAHRTVPEYLGWAEAPQSDRVGLAMPRQTGRVAPRQADWTHAGQAGLADAPQAGWAHAQQSGLSDGPQAEWVGGHALPQESERDSLGAQPEFARLLAESLSRGAGDANDISEFAHVDPGPGFDISGMGLNVEADTSTLRPIFAGVESDGFDVGAFETFIADLGLMHFKAIEFLFLGNSNAPGRSCDGRNALPPQSLWPKIAHSALMLDEIRARLGAPVRILSCYRNASYNSCVGGASGSLHMQFNAIDWRCDSGTVDEWHSAAIAVRQSRSGFAGGIGAYRNSGFVHIDTRGSNADWTG